MGVLFAPVPILHPGEGKIGKRFALVFNGQAAGFIAFGKDDGVLSRLIAACETLEPQNRSAAK